MNHIRYNEEIKTGGCNTNSKHTLEDIGVVNTHYLHVNSVSLKGCT